MKIYFLAVLLSTGMVAEGVEPFQFQVYRGKQLRRREPGQLTITDSGVSYRSDNEKTSLVLSFADIKRADLSDPSRIELERYDITKWRLGREKVLSFHLREGKHGEDLARYFAEHLKRPVVGSYSLPSAEDAVSIPAYHRELLGGAHGVLVIGSEGIRFESKKPKESRTWLYRDIETIGTSDPFHFRLTSFVETFAFDLKERLPDAAYQLAWRQVYKLGPARRVPSGEK
jgi:hypothetical protein